MMEVENNWKFIYLGANQDSFDVSDFLGINPDNSATYDYTQKGFRDIIQEVSSCISECISTNNVSIDNFVLKNNTN